MMKNKTENATIVGVLDLRKSLVGNLRRGRGGANGPQPDYG